MRVLYVDRFEGIYCICEDENRKVFALPIDELPAQIKEGDIIKIDDEGSITVDKQATDKRRAMIRSIEDKLFGKK